MKLKPLLSLILFAAFFVANAQQNNIPSEQKLYINFNGNTSDNSLTGLIPTTTNVSFEADRNTNSQRAGRFGGCNALSYIQVPDNTNQIDFTTGGTIALWAKPDLNNSMDPGDGSCIANGRHMFFSKGGDGFFTPPGFYAYTSINNGVQTIAFESSSGSGNVRDSFTLPYTDAWHHYTFTFTTTNLKVYVDGVLKRDVVINLNFTEANSQALYVGTLGPKSPPALGITYWLPFGGLMDDFRLFTKALISTEVTEVFQYADESIPTTAGEVLFVDFNNNTANQTSSGLSPSSTNISFEVARNSNSLQAGRFGGCNTLSYIQVPYNANQMDFTTGGSVALWAKPDLNNSMNPSDGSCISSGRHMFFSKGGDGFDTPPGFYAYTSINNGVQTIAFESSSGSGNVRDSFTLPYTDAWHHYAFVFTTTSLKVYVDGVLKRDVTISLSFTEANNQTLFVGTLGPKSAPALGITYWFPFGGLMDDFRLFTKALTAAEVAEVFQFVEVSGVAPNVIYFKGLVSSSGYSSSSSTKIALNSGELVFTSLRGRGRSISSSSSLVALDWYDGNNILLKRDILFSCDRPFGSSHCPSYSGSFEKIIGRNGFMSLNFSGESIFANSKWVIDIDNQAVLFSVNSYSYDKPLILFYRNGFYYTAATRWDGTASGNHFILSKINNVGITVESINLWNANINDYDWGGGNNLLLGGTQNTYLINLDNLSYSSSSITAKKCKWVGENFIISNDNNTYLVTKQFALTTLTNDFRKVDILSSGDYLLSTETNVLKYGSNHSLKSSYTGIGNFTFLSNTDNLFVKENNHVKIYDADFNVMWQMNVAANSSAEIQKVNHEYFLTETSYPSYFSAIKKLSSSGNLLWQKNILGSVRDLQLLSNGDLSYISSYYSGTVDSYQANHFLTHLNQSDQPCNYSLSTNVNNAYCSSSTFNTAFIKMGNRIDFNNSLIGLPTDFEAYWEKDGSRIQNNGLNTYQINVTESGTYKATVNQGNCSKSVTKDVTFSDVYNPTPPTLTVVNSEICEGDSATITFTGCADKIFWSPFLRDDNSNDNVIKFKPASSGSYTATCFEANTAYGSCRSDPSNSVNVSLTTFPQNINLGGNSPLSATYRAERINSQQSVIINGAIDYKSKNAIVLNPGFSTESNAVFNAKIVSSCTE